MRVSRGATLILPIPTGIETHSCLLTGATVGARRAGSRVDFTFTGRCVAPSRSSLLPAKKLLVPFIACMLLVSAYQCFCCLSIAEFPGFLAILQ
jgi:hypothetical protein